MILVSSTGRFKWQATVPAVVLPRIESGIDYGAERLLLARSDRGLVWWQLGHTGWYRVGEQKYYAAGLCLRPLDPHERVGAEPLFRGGRLSRARLHEHRAAIATHLGVPMDGLPELLRSRTVTLQSRP